MLRLHKPLLAAFALLALIVAGCGSSSSKTSSTATTANGKTTTNKKTSTDKSKAKQAQDPKACGKLKITPETTTEGTCNQGQGKEKHSVTIVNGTSTLNLKELDAKVVKVSTPSSIPGPAGDLKPKSAKDKKGKTIPKAFVVVELTWKNKDSKSQTLNEKGNQVRINSAGGGGQAFLPGNKNEAKSFYNQGPAKPGKKQKGVIVYQVPETAAKGIKLRGAHPQLAVWEFSTAGKKKEPPTGFIRLWNV